jgi:hypothetical protein
VCTVSLKRALQLDDEFVYKFHVLRRSRISNFVWARDSIRNSGGAGATAE